MWQKLLLSETTFSQHSYHPCFVLLFHTEERLTAPRDYFISAHPRLNTNHNRSQQHFRIYDQSNTSANLLRDFKGHFTNIRILCTQVPAPTDSCCVHTDIPCVCPVTTFPLPELQCWQLLWTGSWHFKCHVRPPAAPFAAAKGKATLINARKRSATPTAEWPLKPQKAADVRDTAHYKTRTRLSVENHENKQLVLDQASHQLCLKAALERSQHSLVQALAWGMMKSTSLPSEVLKQLWNIQVQPSTPQNTKFFPSSVEEKLSESTEQSRERCQALRGHTNQAEMGRWWQSLSAFQPCPIKRVAGLHCWALPRPKANHIKILLQPLSWYSMPWDLRHSKEAFSFFLVRGWGWAQSYLFTLIIMIPYKENVKKTYFIQEKAT